MEEEQMKMVKLWFKNLYKIYYYYQDIIDNIDRQDMDKQIKLICCGIIKDFGLGIEKIKKIKPDIKLSKELNQSLDEYLKFREEFFKTTDFSKSRIYLSKDSIKKLIQNLKSTLNLFYYEVVKKEYLDNNELTSNEILLDRIYELQNKVEDHVLVRNSFSSGDYYKILVLYKDLLENIDKLSDLENLLTESRDKKTEENNISVLSQIDVIENTINSILKTI